MTESTQKAVESAKHLVKSVNDGRTTRVYKSTLEYAEALVELAVETDRLTFALHRCRVHPCAPRLRVRDDADGAQERLRSALAAGSIGR